MSDDYSGDFWSHELFWRCLASGEYGSDLGPAESDVFFRVVGASFLVCNSAAFSAMEEGLEEEGRYAKVREFLEDFLGFVRTVIVSNACVVSSHYKVGASEVFSYDGMENRFPRSSIHRFEGQYRHHSSVLQLIVLNLNVIGLQNNLVLEITFLFSTDNGVNK